MKIKRLYFLGLILSALVFGTTAQAQRYQETFTGTVVSYGNGFNSRMVTAPFTLQIKHWTPNDQAMNYLTVLQDSGQNALMSAIRNQDVGGFSVGGNLARTVNVATETMVDGKRRIYIVFERWTRFAEVRGGYRSLDYPFGYMELNIDPRTGKGEGTYIAAAKIRWQRSGDNGMGPHVEVQDFATFPARLMNVRSQSRS